MKLKDSIEQAIVIRALWLHSECYLDMDKQDYKLVDDLQERYTQFGIEMVISVSDVNFLTSIANGHYGDENSED